jgi:hypothetical protein
VNVPSGREKNLSPFDHICKEENTDGSKKSKKYQEAAKAVDADQAVHP